MSRSAIPARFNAARTLGLLASERISWVPVVPTMLAAWCADQSDAEKPGALRWVLSAGAPLADALALRAEGKLGVSVRQGYGMTEATFTAINAPPDERVLGSVGKPAWGVHVRVVDERGNDLPVGHDGEVLVAGHNVMTRYLHDDGATQEALAHGFMHSGDIGHLDERGHLWIVDRKKTSDPSGQSVSVEVEPRSRPILPCHVAGIGRPDASTARKWSRWSCAKRA